MKIKHVFWIVFLLNLIYSITLVNFLPFKTPGDKTGFLLSCNVLYLFAYGVFALYPRIAIPLLKRIENRQQIVSFPSTIIRFGLKLLPIIGIAGALHIWIFVLPSAYTNENFMRMNGVSMSLGMLLGGISGLYRVRKHFAT